MYRAHAVCKLTVIDTGFEGETASYHQVSGGWSMIVAITKRLLETAELSSPLRGEVRRSRGGDGVIGFPDSSS